jgi:peptidyl-prolyl cis-trans isomerase D
MTGALRTTARNPIAVALMGLLILVFLILGVGGAGRFPDLFAGAHGDAVVVASGHTMNAQDFRKIFDQEKERFEQQAKQDVPVDMLVKNGFHLQLLNAIADDESESEWLARMGINPDPSLVGDEIKKLPFAFDRVTGKFSEQQYVQFLANQGLTPRQAEAELTDQLSQRHFGVAIENGFRIPFTYAALNAAVALENRDVSYFTIDAHIVAAPALPTDAQLIAFMNEHSAQLKRPELRIITLVRFSAKALEPTVTVDPAAVQKEFDFRKDSLSSPERRTVIAIPAKTTAQASEAAARLAKGESPDEAARSVGVEPVVYTDAAQTAIPDRKVATAAFALAAGQSSGPIEGDLGLAVLKVIKITPPVTPDFQTMRPSIEADLRTKAAKNQAYELSQKFDDARQGGATVLDAARKAGVAVITVGPVTADGVDVNGKQNTDLTPQILKSAFARAQGEDGDLEDAGSGEYFAVHVDRVLPPSLPPLDEKRDLLTKAYMHEQILKALKTRADTLIAEVRKGASMDQAAAQVGAHLIHQAGMERMQAQQYKALGGEFLQGVFTGKPGDVFAAGADNGLNVIRLDAVRPGDIPTMAHAVQTIEAKLTQQYLQDLTNATKSGARKEVGATINTTLALQALGIDPSTLSAPAGKPATASK